MKKIWSRLSAGTVALMLLTSGILPIGPDLATVSAEARTVTKPASYMTTYVTKKAVDMKAGKHRKNKTLNTIPKGKTVTHVKSYGSWTQVKYGSKTGYVPTSSLGNKKVVTVKPAPKPTPGLTTDEKEKVMKTVYSYKGNNDYNLSFYTKKTAETKYLGNATISPQGETNASIRFDGDLYNMSIYIEPDSFGGGVYETGKEIYAKYNKALLAFAEVELGKQNAETFRKEFEKFSANASSNQKPITKTIGGKKVTFSWDGYDYVADIK